ncbi:MAG: hypothetical protein SNJ57_03945 [Cyanobacteriota bacterium]
MMRKKWGDSEQLGENHQGNFVYSLRMPTLAGAIANRLQIATQRYKLPAKTTAA